MLLFANSVSIYVEFVLNIQILYGYIYLHYTDCSCINRQTDRQINYMFQEKIHPLIYRLRKQAQLQ